MEHITKRVLTKKSKFKIGKYCDYTINELLELNKKKEIVSAYFKLTSFDLNDELKELLNIKGKFNIKKPSKNPKLYVEWIKNYAEFRPFATKIDAIMRKEQRISKGKMSRINQGH